MKNNWGKKKQKDHQHLNEFYKSDCTFFGRICCCRWSRPLRCLYRCPGHWLAWRGLRHSQGRLARQLFRPSWPSTGQSRHLRCRARMFGCQTWAPAAFHTRAPSSDLSIDHKVSYSWYIQQCQRNKLDAFDEENTHNSHSRKRGKNVSPRWEVKARFTITILAVRYIRFNSLSGPKGVYKLTISVRSASSRCLLLPEKNIYQQCFQGCTCVSRREICIVVALPVLEQGVWDELSWEFHAVLFPFHPIPF